MTSVAEARTEFDLLLIGEAADRGALDSIAALLEDFGVPARIAAVDPTGAGLSDVSASGRSAGAIAIVLGSAGLTDILERAWSDLLASVDRPPFVILLEGASSDITKVLGIDKPFVVDLRERIDDGRRLRAFATQLARLGIAAPAVPASTSSFGARSADVATRTGRARTESHQPEDVPGWGEFEDVAKAALGAADAVRAATSQAEIHMEHLLAGLYRQDPGPLRQVIASAGMSEAAFRTILESSPQGPLPEAAHVQVKPLDRLPRLSSHARRALVAARSVAAQRGTATIETRHMAAGALSITDCDAIAGLLAGRVDPEQVLTWDEPLTPKASAQTDQPTLDDLLGYSSIVDALTELITAPETTFPLTIAISAPWGGGKSSVMRMLRRRLRPRNPSRPTPATIRPKDRWVLVDFPAWRYDTGEQLWAAMAKVTFDAARVGIGWWDRVRLRWAVERPRIPVLATVLRVVFAGLGGVLGYAIGTIIGSIAGPQIEDSTAGVVGGIGGAAAAGRAFWESASDPFKRAVASIGAQPGIAATDGFSPDEERRIRALMRVLLTERAGVVIFIDDLDRCTPRNLVRVIEVVNQIFVASADAAAPAAEDDPGLTAGPPEPGARRLVFVMGMDREVVARGVEAEYEKLLEHLRMGGATNGEDFGLAFLDKIIQLWVTLPTPSQAGLDRLLQEAAGIRPAPDPERDARVATLAQAMEAKIAAIPSIDRARLNAELNRFVTDAPPEQRTAARQARAAVRSTLPSTRIADDPRLWEALKIGADCLEPNPRQRKRFNNAFRLQFYLAQDLSLGRDQYAALARLVAIRLRWPRLAHDLDEHHPDLLRALERRANGKNRVAEIDWRTAAAQRRRTKEWFDESQFGDLPELCRILKVDRPEQAVSRLPDEDIPRVA
jgi:hypothetical protein